MLLWLWCRPAAVAPIRPLAWEPPYAMGAALKKKKKKTKDQKKNLFYLDLYQEVFNLGSMSESPGELKKILKPRSHPKHFYFIGLG